MMQPTAVIVSHSALTIASRGFAVGFQAVERVRADRRAFAGGEDQHLAGDGLPFQLVAALDHHAAFGIDAAEEGDAHAR